PVQARAAHRALHSFPTRRSSDLLAVLAQGLEEQALGRFAGNECRARGAALEQAGLAVEQQLALDLLGAGRVTRVAFLDQDRANLDRKSTRLNSSHVAISYAVFCL